MYLKLIVCCSLPATTRDVAKNASKTLAYRKLVSPSVRDIIRQKNVAKPSIAAPTAIGTYSKTVKT